ncbi:MAG TPA: glycosyltransferase [Patescibacteria group bacterium]
MLKNTKQPLVSVIIPAYRQEKTIQKDLQRIKKVLDQMRYEYELIVVVDGFEDKTFENAKKEKSSNVFITGYEHNHGKGYAIRYGMVRSKGEIVGFIDSGMDLNPNGISLLLEHFEWYNADIIVGSKRHPVSKVEYPLNRKILSFFSQTFIWILFGLNVRDTQVGLKFFRRKVIEDVLPRLLVKRFAFDIEILAVAYYLGYRRIFEAPVELKHNFSGSIVSQHILDSIFHTFLDSLAIFYRLKLLHYYDTKNKRKWVYDPELDYRVNVG